MSWVIAVCRDAMVGMAARPGKVFLTAFGAMVGVASLVAVAGLTTTASAQILERFDAVAVTQVAAKIVADENAADEPPLAWTATSNLLSLHGVLSATMLARVDASVEVSTLETLDPAAPEQAPAVVYAVDERFADAADIAFEQGRSFDRGHVARGDPVVLLGSVAAARLGVKDLRRHRVIFLNSMPFQVLGIFDQSRADQGYLSAMVLPSGTGIAEFGVRGPDMVHIRTARGAATLVAGQAALALNPVEPDRLVVEHAPEPQALRDQVGRDTQALFLVVGLVSMLAGAVSIMNTMLVSVLERTSEIGLRRAVGARRREVLVQFLAESAVVGLLGGIMGTSLGSVITVTVAASKGWVPTAGWWLPPLGVLLGCLTGVVAGVIPSWRAAQIEPAIALRTA